MDVRQLRYFLAVAEHGHFTRAAQASAVSQPALSQQIQSLERQLGAPLFDRLSTGAELTTAGRVLREHARRVLREMENARVAVEEVTGGVRGELAIAAVSTAGLILVVPLLARLRARHPQLEVRVHELSSAATAEAVVAGRVNLGIAYLPAPHDALDARPVLEEELVLVLPATHELAGGHVTLEQAAALPLIVPPRGYCLRSGIDDALLSEGASARVVAEFSAPGSVCEAVRAGRSCPASRCRGWAWRCCRAPGSNARRTRCAAWRRARLRSRRRVARWRCCDGPTATCVWPPAHSWTHWTSRPPRPERSDRARASSERSRAVLCYPQRTARGGARDPRPTRPPGSIMKIHYDCDACPAYCCTYTRIVTTDEDIQRLADHFDVTFKEARKRFTKKGDEKGERVLRHEHDPFFQSACMFLDQDTRRCTIYEARPEPCRAYPGTPRCGYFDFLTFERELQEDPSLVVAAYIAELTDD